MSKTHELSGRSACGGQATGRPVIVHSPADLDRVGVGDILVSVETEAIFVPAMHRASAVITERGGRFCHAAVWARENDKPTVIAVPHAVSLLAGITQVQVDADRGVIKWET